MRANLAGNIEREFHLIEGLLQICGGDPANDPVAFVANDVGPASTNNAVQTTATIWIAECGVRKERSTDILKSRSLTHRAITRPGKWRDIAVAVGTACIVAIAERNAATARRFRQGADFGVAIDTGQSSATSVTPKTLAVTRPNVRLSYAAFRFARFANGDAALPALIAAHRFLAASAMAFRPAALKRRLRRTGGCAISGTVGADAGGFRPGGRPRRLPPPRASMARFSLSRSARSRATICSVGIRRDSSTCARASATSGSAKFEP
jgi:hypothetical protein